MVPSSVRALADDLQVWPRIEIAVRDRFRDVAMGQRGAEVRIEGLAPIPCQAGRAPTRLGAFVSRGREAVCIRIQFAQEEEALCETLLHEVAHACDHLSGDWFRSGEVSHGPSWRAWARALGIDPARRGSSEKLLALHKSRRKVVAICTRCGFDLVRIRRLNRGTRYVHRRCGGYLVSV